MQPVLVTGDPGISPLPIGVGEAVDTGHVLADAFDPGVLEAVVGLGDPRLAAGDQGGLSLPAGPELLADKTPSLVVDDFSSSD